jgi:hypothetical protein
MTAIYIELVPSVFVAKDRDGDFRWMIERPEHARSLFVFNDNEGQFDHLMSAISPGGGNAAIRPYQLHGPKAAASRPARAMARSMPGPRGRSIWPFAASRRCWRPGPTTG